MLNNMHLFMQNHYLQNSYPELYHFRRTTLIFLHDENNDIAGIRLQGLALQLVSYYSMAIDG